MFLHQTAKELVKMGHSIVWRVPPNSEIQARNQDADSVWRDNRAQADATLANDFRSLWKSLLFDKVPKRVFIVHGEWQLSQMRAWIIRLSGTRVLTVSNYVREAAYASGMPGPIKILPLGPSPVRIASRPTPPPNRQPRETVFGTVARLDPIKRLPLFARLVAQMDARGIVVCPKPESSIEQDIVDQLRQHPCIELRVDGKVPDLWQDIDYFLSTSAAESLGLTHLEALAAGVPVISMAAHGPEDFLKGHLAKGRIDIRDTSDDQLIKGITTSIMLIDAAWQPYWENAQHTIESRGPEACAEMILGIL